MTALAADLQLEEKDGIVHDAPMAVDIIYRGAMLVFNAAGFLAPVTGAVVGDVFAGIAQEKKDNSAGSAGDISCRYKKKSRWLMTGAGLAQTDVGVKVYGSDDQTITTTFAANLPLIGVIDQFVSSTQVWVQAEPLGDTGEAAVADLGTTTNLTALVPVATTHTALVITATTHTALVPAASSITASAGTYAIAAEPTGAEVDTAIDQATAKVDTGLDLKADNTDVETLRTEIQTSMDLKADNADVETLRTEIQTAMDLKSDNADAETLRTEVEARLDAIEAKVDAALPILRKYRMIQG